MTVIQESIKTIRDAARELADYNMQESPDLVGIW